jgi:hypothetical protein
MTALPPRLLPASHADLQPSDWTICPILSRGNTDRNCLGRRCAAWSPAAATLLDFGLCKLIEGAHRHE